MTIDQIAAVKAGFFRVLGHPARVRILEALRDGDKTVGELQAWLDLDSSSTSQHLAALKQQGIVESAKHGTHVHYSARDPRVFQLLEIARIIIVSQLDETRALLEELLGARGPAGRRRGDRAHSVTPIVALSVAGAGIVAAGGLLALWRRARPLSYAVEATGVASLGAAGVLLLLGGPEAGAAFSNGVGLAFGLDALTGFFLLTLAACACPALVYASASMREAPHGASLGALGAAFVLSLAGVLAARSALTFLLFWELMTLLPAAAILVTRQQRSARTAVFQYLAITHLGGAGVWVSLLLLAAVGGIGDPAATQAAGATLAAVIAIAAVVGFGTKAGVMPFHTWLPRAHPLAPGHFSALMSGVMVKVAVYGLVRVVFEWLGASPLWLGLLLIALGALSALGGVTYAIFQHELKRLLAFHTIENVGIIFLGLGAALLFEARDQPGWAALALAAALFHTLNHALFKGLLFLAAGSFARAVHGLELDRLGGLLRRMRWTGGGFLIGAMAIAGLPPLNGFVSEWLTLQALVHLASSTGVIGQRLRPGHRARGGTRDRRPRGHGRPRRLLLRQGRRAHAARPTSHPGVRGSARSAARRWSPAHRCSPERAWSSGSSPVCSSRDC